MRMDETREQVLARLEQASEEALARRIRDERMKRGLSQEKLARAVEEFIGPGFPQSAVSKIEQDHNRRSITVDEAIALAKVFEIPLEDLLLPPAVELDERLAVLLGDAGRARTHIERALRAYEDELKALLEFVATPGAGAALAGTYDFWRTAEPRKRPIFYWVLEEIFEAVGENPLGTSARIQARLADLRKAAS